VANSACGAVVQLSQHRKLEFLVNDPEEPDEEREAQEFKQHIQETCKEEGGVWFPV